MNKKFLFITYAFFLVFSLFLVNNISATSEGITTVLPEYYNMFGVSIGNRLDAVCNYQEKGALDPANGGLSIDMPTFWNYRIESVNIDSENRDIYLENKFPNMTNSIMITKKATYRFLKRSLKFTSYTLDKVQFKGVSWNLDYPAGGVKGIFTAPGIMGDIGNHASGDWTEAWGFRTFREFGINSEVGPCNFQLGLNALRLYNTQKMVNIPPQRENRIYGLDIQNANLFGLEVEAEYERNENKVYNAAEKVAITSSTASVYFYNFKRKFTGDTDEITINYEFYNNDPGYSTSLDGYNLVNDNDDKSIFVDPDSTNNTVTKIDRFNLLYDKNFNGINDWNEDGLRFYNDPPSFWLGEDKNHNGIIDKYEDDSLPDYRHPQLNRKGADFSITYNPKYISPDLTLTLRSLDEKNVKSSIDGGLKESKDNSITTNYAAKISNSLCVFNLQVRNISDNLQDDTVVHQGFGGTDNLYYKNSLFIWPSVVIQFKELANLDIQSQISYKQNRMLDDKKTSSWAGSFSKASYKYKLPFDNFLGNLSLIPGYKILTEKSSESPKPLGAQTPATQNSYYNLGLFRTEYTFAENIILSLGTEYLRYTDLLDTFNNTNNSYFRKWYGAELFINSKAAFNFTLLAGYKHIYMDYKINDGRNTEEDLYFIKVYARVYR
ncbi:MAG: hypothetical protein KKH91_05900 [Elusimicrobia bacterium]|nr:hypothetical protein [Elusimicrobiota bacterium]